MSSRSADSQLFQARNCRSPICTLYAFFYINLACIFLRRPWQTISILLQKCRNLARLDLCCWNACARALLLVSWTMCGMRSWENPGALCNCLILAAWPIFYSFVEKHRKIDDITLFSLAFPGLRPSSVGHSGYFVGIAPHIHCSDSP